MEKITPIDIQHKSFKKALQGYDRADVDGFLDEVIETLEDEAQQRAALEKARQQAEKEGKPMPAAPSSFDLPPDEDDDDDDDDDDEDDEAEDAAVAEAGDAGKAKDEKAS